MNQWKNADSVISWFSNLPNKSTRSFINFDIVDFYPSISEELLCEALTFASNYVTITDNEKNMIIQLQRAQCCLAKIKHGARKHQVHSST